MYGKIGQKYLVIILKWLSGKNVVKKSEIHIVLQFKGKLLKKKDGQLLYDPRGIVQDI